MSSCGDIYIILTQNCNTCYYLYPQIYLIQNQYKQSHILQFLHNIIYWMYTIDDFDNFQVCAVVQKTSDSGITSNERLLVIKAGILYYHSKVPANYNNDLKTFNSLNNIPKCSIFTPYLKTIKIDPKSGFTLILTFLSKDLKQKEELTKRASTIQPLELQKQQKQDNKNNGKMTEWKFKFPSTLKCKHWYKYLQQLKDHYKKVQQQQNEMYERFFEDFNQNKKLANAQRRSEAFTSKPSIPEVAADLAFRQSQINHNNLKSNNLLNNIVEDQNDKVSETESMRQDQQNRKKNKKKQLQTLVRNKLFEEDNEDENKNQKQKQKQKQTQSQKQQQQERQRLISGQKQKQKQRIENEKRQNQTSYQQKTNHKNQKNYENVDQFQTKNYDSPNQKEQSKNSVDRQMQKELEKERQMQKQRLQLIEFAKKRQRERADRERRQLQDQRKRQKEKEEEENERERERQRQKEMQRERLEMIQRDHREARSNKNLQKDGPEFQITQNILASQSEKSVEYQNRDAQSSISANGFNFNNYSLYREKSASQFFEKSSSQTVLLKFKKQKHAPRKKSVCQIQNTAFMNYIQYQQQIFKDKFQQRMLKQTQFLKYVVKLRQQVRNVFQSIINQLSSPKERRTHHLVGKYYTSDRINIQFAFCQTKTIALYQGEQTLYDESQYKILTQKFRIYNQIQSNILLALKKKQKICLRVPFYMMIQYKGVMGLAKVNDFLIDSEIINIENSSIQLINEAALIIPSHLIHNFRLCKVFESDKYLIQIQTLFHQESSTEQKQILNLSKPIDINRKLRYPSLEKTKDSIFNNTDKLSSEQYENLELLLYTYYVRRLYRSGQGQVDAKDFFPLILSLNSEYSKLLGVSCPSKYPLKGLFCEYINQLCGVSIELEELSGVQDLLAGNISSVSYRSLIQIYSFPHLQVFSLIDSFQQFLGKQSSTEILKYWKIYSQKDQNLDQIYSLFRILVFNNASNKPKALQQIQILLSTLRYTHPLKLKCYELLLNHYYQQNNKEIFVQCFKEAMNYVEFTFGNHNTLVTLSCILGQFLNNHGKSEEALTLYSSMMEKTTNSRILTQMEIDKSSIELNLTNRQNINQKIISTLNLLGKKQGLSRIKLIKFLAYLYNSAGKHHEAMDYINQSISYFETDKPSPDLIQSYMLGSTIYQNNFTKQKQFTTKMYEIAKMDHRQIDKVSELFKRILLKLSTKNSIQIQFKKIQESKKELFEKIKERIGTINPVQYLHQIFAKMVEQQQSEEISELLQFSFN